MNFAEEVRRFCPTCAEEVGDKLTMSDWIRQYPDTILTRENTFAHMTSSAMIFDPTMQQVLMIYHNIYRSWSWTGGHADGDADLLAVALREATEETGVRVLTPLSERATGLDVLTVNGHFKHGQWVSSHLHLSLCYSFTADPDAPLRIKPDENSGVRWLPVDRLEEYVSEPQMLPVYHRIIRRSLALKNI